MRAELTKVGDNVLDLAFIDEDKLNGEKLLELLAKTQKISHLVLQTLDTGENTQRLLSLCEKIAASNDEVSEEIMSVLGQIDLGIQRMFTVFGTTDVKDDPDIVKKLQLVLQLDQNKAQALREYRHKVKASSTVTTTVSKLLLQLYNKQKEQGSDFKHDTANLQYLTLSNQLLDTQWKVFRQAQGAMLEQGRQVSMIDMQKGALRIATGESSKEMVREISLKEVHKMKAGLGLAETLLG